MSNASIELGEGKWAVKPTLLLGRAEQDTCAIPEVMPIPFDVDRASDVWVTGRDGLLKVANVQGDELIENGTDWIGGDVGTPDNWDSLGSRTPSHVTGNGFTGVAQRFDAIANFAGISKTIVEIGKKYIVSFKYRADTIAYVDIGVQVDLPINTGDALVYSYVEVAGQTILTFKTGLAGSWLEIDDVSIKEYNSHDIAAIDFSEDAEGVLLTQPQSTNLVTYSEDFSDAYWTVASSNITTVFGQSSPDGTLNATRITATAGSPSRLRGQSTITSGVSTTVSLYIKRVSGSGIVSFFNANGGSAVSLPITNEWERYSVSVVSTSTTGSFILDIATDGDIIDVWGAQLEQLSYATSYIPTSGASATRLEDVITGAGSTSSINSEEGVLYFEGASFVDIGNDSEITISDGTTNNRVYLIYI